MRLEIAAVLLILGCGCADTNFSQASGPVCAGDPADMPESWRPPAKFKTVLNTSPWSAEEGRDAVRAAETGVDELSRFYSSRPAAVLALGDNAVESLLDASYAASNMPGLREQARTSAREVLAQLIMPYVARGAGPARCRQYSMVLTLTVYTHALFEPDDPRITRMVAQSNAAYAACGSFDAAIGTNFRRVLGRPDASMDDI